MYNLAFKVPKVKKSVPVPIPNMVEHVDSLGNVTYIECSNPYEGLDASSFELSAQLAAGVPLSPVGALQGDSIHSVDRNNDNALAFMNKLNGN